MRQIQLSIPEVAFIAGARGALGAGVGLLVSGRMNQMRRRAASQLRGFHSVRNECPTSRATGSK